MIDPIETPETKVAQYIGFLVLRMIALEHERDVLKAKLVEVVS